MATRLVQTRALRRTCTCTTLLCGTCKIGYCDHDARANLLGVSAAHAGIRAGHFGSRTDCLPDLHTLSLQIQTCRATRENMTRRPPGITWTGHHPRSDTRRTATLAGVSGPPRGYQSDYEDRSRQWEDHKASGPATEKERVSEVVAVAELEVVDNRDKDLGRAAADSATYIAPAHNTWDSPAETDTEKEAFRSRLGELHRLLDNRKESFSATYKKNAEPNDRAYDMSQMTVQALDTLVAEYGNFEVSMKKVTSEHEEGMCCVQ